MSRKAPKAFLLALAALCPPSASAAPRVEQLYSAIVQSDGVRFSNSSDRFLDLQVEITGTNFRAEGRCRTTIYLGPGGAHVLKVAAKKPGSVVDYRIVVTRVTAKTREELQAERGGQSSLPPTPKPLPPAAMQNLESFACESH
jgi:hypothetical protein